MTKVAGQTLTALIPFIYTGVYEDWSTFIAADPSHALQWVGKSLPQSVSQLYNGTVLYYVLGNTEKRDQWRKQTRYR